MLLRGCLQSPHPPLEEGISTSGASKVEELLAPQVWGIWDDDPRDVSFACKISFSSSRWLLAACSPVLSFSAWVSSHSASSTDHCCRRQSWESTRSYHAHWYVHAWAADARARCAPYSAHMAQPVQWVMYAPDVVVLDLTVWKVPEDPLMLETETTTSK